ncbi:protein regulator of cytokinesis 1 prc1 [Anopheles sinensis]|uniref:Protein regulator of cytokinesis 1 prc1 n=1 Tax=Anopheles sinensis TaxID=74873 RepID=A0A084WBJ7_ANOSI|nr:protein regulator of cytokinesis 1 prc1 [Anopheles sinensis]
MNNIEQETIAKSCRIVTDKVHMLAKVWKTYFDDNCYLRYMTSLPESIGMFLNEILQLTMQYCVQKTHQIQQLRATVADLQHMLDGNGVRETQWVEQQMSLDRRVMLLKEEMFALQSKIAERRRQLDQYIEELTKLCNGSYKHNISANHTAIAISSSHLELGNDRPNLKHLYNADEASVLPDDQTIKRFEEYAASLRKEKQKRKACIDQIQQDLRAKAKQLNWEPRKPEQQTLLNNPNLPPTTQTIAALETLYSVVCRLVGGKLQQQWQTKSSAPLRDNPSPPPPPPSPEGEQATVASSSSSSSSSSRLQQSALEKTLSQLQLDAAGRREGGLLEVCISRYQQLLADSCTDLSRERIITDIFHSMQAHVHLWWDRCLIGEEDRKRSNVLLNFPNQDEQAMVALVEEQSELEAYYNENKRIFLIIYHWSEGWSMYLRLDSKGRGVGGPKTKKKALINDVEKKQLRQVKEQLTMLEAELTIMCAEYEQRKKTAFTIFGQPAMDVLFTLKEQRKELTLPTYGDPKRTPRVVTRKVLRLKQIDSEEQQVGDRARQNVDTGTDTSSDSEADDTRDDELLQEAFASASTVIKKTRTSIENGARPKGSLGALDHQTNINNNISPARDSTIPPLSIGTSVIQNPKNRETAKLAETLKEKSASPAGTRNTAELENLVAPTNVLAVTATSPATVDKVRSKSKQSVKREPSLII